MNARVLNSIITDLFQLSCHDYMRKYKFDPIKIYPYCSEKFKDIWACSLDKKEVVTCAGNKLDINNSQYTLPQQFHGDS